MALYGNGAHKAVSLYCNVSDSASFTSINSFRLQMSPAIDDYAILRQGQPS